MNLSSLLVGVCHWHQLSNVQIKCPQATRNRYEYWERASLATRLLQHCSLPPPTHTDPRTEQPRHTASRELCWGQLKTKARLQQLLCAAEKKDQLDMDKSQDGTQQLSQTSGLEHLPIISGLQDFHGTYSIFKHLTAIPFLFYCISNGSQMHYSAPSCYWQPLAAFPLAN